MDDQRSFGRWLASRLRDDRVDSWDIAVERLLAADAFVADVRGADVRGADVRAADVRGTDSRVTASGDALLDALQRLRTALSQPSMFVGADQPSVAGDAAFVPTLYDTPTAFDSSVIAPLLRAVADRLDDPAFSTPEGSRP